MTRDEYYNSPEFKTNRLLNNMVHDLKQQTQRIYDVLALVLERKPDLIFFDKFNLVERQLRIVDAEAARLIRETSALEHMLYPKNFDDITLPSSGHEVKEAAPNDDRATSEGQEGVPAV